MLWIGIVSSKQLLIYLVLLGRLQIQWREPSFENVCAYECWQLQICAVLLIWEHLTAAFPLMFGRNTCNLLWSGLKSLHHPYCFCCNTCVRSLKECQWFIKPVLMTLYPQCSCVRKEQVRKSINNCIGVTLEWPNWAWENILTDNAIHVWS